MGTTHKHVQLEEYSGTFIFSSFYDAFSVTKIMYSVEW
jgi:hypothetical protein